MALLKEVWLADIQKTIEEDAAFLKRMRDSSGYISNAFINIPQSGAATQVFKNVSNFPLTVAQRTDAVKQIKMDQYSTQAFLVTDLESAQLSYDKRNDIMGQHTRKMVETAGINVLTAVTPTGDATRTVTVAAGAKVTYATILEIAKKLDLDKVSKTDRSLELSTDAFYELLQDDNIAKAYANGFAYSTIESGSVLKVAGISIFERVTVAAGSIGVAYQKDYATAAVGNIDFMTDFGDNGNGNPLYLGGIMSAIMWLGAGTMYTDKRGTVNLVRA